MAASLVNPAADTPSVTSLESMWADALEYYKGETGLDLLKPPPPMDRLFSCDSGDKVADILEDSAPVVFDAFGALLEAAKGVSAVYSALENLLSQFQATLVRVDEYVNGHTDVARLLLGRRAAIDSRQNNEWTPLHSVAENSHADVVRLLLDDQAAADARGIDRWTPLYLAAQNGHTDVARLLFEHRAAIDLQEVGEWTRLYVAALKGRADVAPLLLEPRADINACSNEDKTPIYAAAEFGRVSVVHYLIDRGVAFDIYAKNGYIAPSIAEENHHADVVHLVRYRTS